MYADHFTSICKKPVSESRYSVLPTSRLISSISNLTFKLISPLHRGWNIASVNLVYLPSWERPPLSNTRTPPDKATWLTRQPVTISFMSYHACCLIDSPGCGLNSALRRMRNLCGSWNETALRCRGGLPDGRRSGMQTVRKGLHTCEPGAGRCSDY